MSKYLSKWKIAWEAEHYVEAVEALWDISKDAPFDLKDYEAVALFLARIAEIDSTSTIKRVLMEFLFNEDSRKVMLLAFRAKSQVTEK